MSAAGPLAGLGVVLTRPRAQCRDIADELEARGARVIVFPALDIVRVELSAAKILFWMFLCQMNVVFLTRGRFSRA